MPSRCGRVCFALVVGSCLARNIAFNLNDVANHLLRPWGNAENIHESKKTILKDAFGFCLLVTVWSSVVPFTLRPSTCS